MSRLRELVLLVNQRCNLGCTYCSFRGPAGQPGIEVQPGRVWKAIDLFFDGAQSEPRLPRVLCFDADGEALASRQLVEEALARAARAKQQVGASATVIALVTNGTLVDTPFATLLRDLNVVATVSLDGPASSHDHHRVHPNGQPSHEAVTRGIALLREAGVPTSLRAVVTPETLGGLRQTWSTLHAENPARPVKLRPVRATQPPLYDPGWIESYTQTYVRCTLDLLRDGVPWTDLPDHARQIAAWLVEGTPRGHYCEAGHGMLWMTPAGALVPCGLLSQHPDTLGQIDEQAEPTDLEALLDHPLSTLFREQAPPTRDPCASCRWLPACGGGCPFEAMDTNLEPTQPALCTLYRTLGTALETAFAT